VTFAAEVREELAHVRDEGEAAQLAEVVTGLRIGGALHIGHGAAGLSITTGSGAVARRLRARVAALTGARSDIEVHAAQGLATGARYRLVWHPKDAGALVRLGLLDDHGRPLEGLPAGPVAAAPAAALRGALMVAGSVSDPAKPPHLEIAAPGRRSAEDVAALLRAVGAVGARARVHGDGWRVVVKSGSGIATVLARAGAHTAFLRYDQGRLRRELRAQANRAANADGANLQRSMAAASRQVEAVEAALRRSSLEDLSPELASVALARIANPQASLTELGALLDPPAGKATVHRRLGRLEALARESDAAPG